MRFPDRKRSVIWPACMSLKNSLHDTCSRTVLHSHLRCPCPNVSVCMSLRKRTPDSALQIRRDLDIMRCIQVQTQILESGNTPMFLLQVLLRGAYAHAPRDYKIKLFDCETYMQIAEWTSPCNHEFCVVTDVSFTRSGTPQVYYVESCNRCQRITFYDTVSKEPFPGEFMQES